ncbi:hypothetical protein Q31b_21220 [Novipirellula aureliae]|uniref:Uncharacterized protein n=1 Tax=Novipirellula aureliae TaxID=2527966 RepID=A0A5C6E2Y6_9BACT|nr:hypothetical protein [Novipirellula aureliae]TWU43085.1 hypothetical protein Q31b_21220 [Novipirellula aureliae]
MLLKKNGTRTLNRLVLSVAALSVLSLTTMPSGIAQDTMQTPNSQAQGGTSVADSSDPVVVVTLGSINKLMQDTNYISGVVGQPQFGGMFQMMAGTFTQGMNMNEPIAVVVPLVDGSPEPIVLLPTSDVKTVLKRLEAQTGPADELDDGTMVIAVGANTVYIRQVGDWAALARNRDLLDLAPQDPKSVMTGMGNKYDMAVRVRVQQIPTETRTMLIESMRQGFEQAISKQDQADAEGTKAVAESSIEQIEQLIQNTDEIMFGWNIDQSDKAVHFDGSMTAVEGSKLAGMYGGQTSIPSMFASVIRDDAAAYYHTAASISPEAIEQTVKSLQTAMIQLDKAIVESDNLDDEKRIEIQALAGRLVDLASDSVKEGKADLGALLLANENDFQFVFGSFVADGNEAANIVKDLAAKLENEPKAPTFLFDQETYKDVVMHVVEADVPANEDEARKVFGDKLRVHLGTGPKSLYVAFGNNSQSLMKQLIDAGASDNGGDRPLGQFKLKLLPILKYAQSVENNDTVGAMVNSLANAADEGEIRAMGNGIKNGQSSRFTITEGLLQAIGAAVQQTQQAKMQQNGEF